MSSVSMRYCDCRIMNHELGRGGYPIVDEIIDASLCYLITVAAGFPLRQGGLGICNYVCMAEGHLGLAG